MENLKLDALIADLKKADALQEKIQSTQKEIHRLQNRVQRKVSDYVYACGSPDELGELCDAVGLDNKGYRWGWEEAYENSYGGDTDYNKTEWSDVLFHVDLDLRMHIEKLAKQKGI